MVNRVLRGCLMIQELLSFTTVFQRIARMKQTELTLDCSNERGTHKIKYAHSCLVSVHTNLLTGQFSLFLQNGGHKNLINVIFISVFIHILNNMKILIFREILIKVKINSKLLF